MTSRFLRIDASGAPEEGVPPADRIVSGNPHTRTWNVEEAEGDQVVIGAPAGSDGLSHQRPQQRDVKHRDQYLDGGERHLPVLPGADDARRVGLELESQELGQARPTARRIAVAALAPEVDSQRDRDAD